jgi:hypothetical protein
MPAAAVAGLRELQEVRRGAIAIAFGRKVTARHTAKGGVRSALGDCTAGTRLPGGDWTTHKPEGGRLRSSMARCA